MSRAAKWRSLYEKDAEGEYFKSLLFQDLITPDLVGFLIDIWGVHDDDFFEWFEKTIGLDRRITSYLWVYSKEGEFCYPCIRSDRNNIEGDKVIEEFPRSVYNVLVWICEDMGHSPNTIRKLNKYEKPEWMDEYAKKNLMKRLKRTEESRKELLELKEKEKKRKAEEELKVKKGKKKN